MENKFEFGGTCACGRVHRSSVKRVIAESGAIARLPEVIGELSCKRAFVVCDRNTYRAAGERVVAVLREAAVEFSTYIFDTDALEPNEWAVGSLTMHLDKGADILVAVGSGTLNDICKIVSRTASLPYVIVATAPSMDGYASASSSMVMDGLKISLASRCPDVIIGESEVICAAPWRMLVSGLGDMLAKYVSIAEWRIAAILCGEYYCDYIADYVRYALKLCTDNIEGLKKRDEKCVMAVFDGLIACGSAMEYAGLSRPASGVEHYISHVWDMRSAELGTAADTHGIQCAIGTLIASEIYYKLISEYTPDRTRAKNYVEKFDFSKWSEVLRAHLATSAEPMIRQEAKEGKYNLDSHGKRLELIVENWDRIIEIIRNEIPTPESIRELLVELECPTSPEEIGIDRSTMPTTFMATKDIRDKYVLSRLLWDLGILDELADGLK